MEESRHQGTGIVGLYGHGHEAPRTAQRQEAEGQVPGLGWGGDGTSVWEDGKGLRIITLWLYVTYRTHLVLLNCKRKTVKMANVTCCVFYHDKQKREREREMPREAEGRAAPAGLGRQMPREPPDAGSGRGRSPAEPPRKSHVC